MRKSKRHYATWIIAALVTLPTWAQEIKKIGSYWVPVGEQLADFALFPLSHVRLEQTSDKVEIEYEIPIELTGARNLVKFSGSRQGEGRMLLKGEYGEMECPVVDDFSNCAVKYRDLKFDAEALTALLQSISNSEEELNKRRLVAARFQTGGEPHGFVRITD